MGTVLPPSLLSLSRIARAQKSGFTIPDAPLRRSDGSDAIIGLSQANKRAGSPAAAAIREGGGLFPCQLEQFPSELNWTPRTAFTCLRRRRRQIALMAADTCNGAEGGEKAPPPPPPKAPPSLISPHSKVMPISPIWVDGIITKEGKRRKSFRLLYLIHLMLEASGAIWVAAMSHHNARFSIGSHFDARCTKWLLPQP